MHKQKTKSDWIEKMKSTTPRLSLVAQEIEAKQKSHYDEEEKQGSSDNFIEIHYLSSEAD